MADNAKPVWHFEPHSLFRSGIDGEDFPVGYISSGNVPRQPIFALHEVIGGLSTKRLVADALVASAARDLLLAASDALAGWRYIREQHGDLYGVGWDRVESALTAAIAKAEGRS